MEQNCYMFGASPIKINIFTGEEPNCVKEAKNILSILLCQYSLKSSTSAKLVYEEHSLKRY